MWKALSCRTVEGAQWPPIQPHSSASFIWVRRVKNRLGKPTKNIYLPPNCAQHNTRVIGAHAQPAIMLWDERCRPMESLDWFTTKSQGPLILAQFWQQVSNIFLFFHSQFLRNSIEKYDEFVCQTVTNLYSFIHWGTFSVSVELDKFTEYVFYNRVRVEKV